MIKLIFTGISINKFYDFCFEVLNFQILSKQKKGVEQKLLNIGRQKMLKPKGLRPSFDWT